ncbi:PEGA domain-containing protein [Rickettsiales bacterium]|nr:PEGA domain-containing protein [Rickettsiales bacterium]
MINRFISIIIISIFISSCAQMNKDRVKITIRSNPANAHLYINNAYYGQTPAHISLIPDSDIDYKATIVGENYQKTIPLETWYSVREGRGEETTRCTLDALGSVLIVPMFSFMSIKCRDFKQQEYLIDAYMAN